MQTNPTPESVIEYIAKVSRAIGIQANVGAMETAGSIVSFLAANPHYLDDLGTFQWPLMGYAPGYYMRPCLDCKAVMTHCDKRATQCLSCALTSILATRTDATPVAWMYVREECSRNKACTVFSTYRWGHNDTPNAGFWTEVPLYTHPPATDVAALVDAAKAMGDDYMTSEHHHPRYVLVPTVAFEHMRQALAPFTKGQNDE